VRRHQGGSRSGDQPSRQCDGRPARPPPRASCLDSGVRRDDAESEERDVRRYGNPGRDRWGGRGSTLRVTDQARAPHPTCSGLRGRRSGGRSDRTRWRAQLGRIKLRSLSYTESGTASKRLSRVGVGAPSLPAVRGLPPPPLHRPQPDGRSGAPTPTMVTPGPRKNHEPAHWPFPGSPIISTVSPVARRSRSCGSCTGQRARALAPESAMSTSERTMTMDFSQDSRG
jgi:hypothetical protein